MTNASSSASSKFNFAGVPPRKKSLGLSSKNGNAASSSLSGSHQQPQSTLPAQQHIPSNQSRPSEVQIPKSAAPFGGNVAASISRRLQATAESTSHRPPSQPIAASYNRPSSENSSSQNGWADDVDIDQMLMDGEDANFQASPTANAGIS